MKKNVFSIQKWLRGLVEYEDEQKKNRLLGLIGTVLCLLVIVLEVNGRLPVEESERNIIPLAFKLVSDCILLALFIVLFAAPRARCILIVTTVLAGLVNIIYGGNILGLLFYAFGFAVAMKYGFFRDGKRLKMVSIMLFFLSFLVLQLKISVETFIISLTNILIAMALIAGFLYLFHDNLKDFYAQKPVLDLGAFGFSDRQRACIMGCLDGKTMKEIADSQCISVSVIKHEMVGVYRALGLEDRYEFHRLCAERQVLV